MDRPAPAPRFASLWAAIVYSLSTLSLAYPAFAGRFLVNPSSDQYIGGYAFREFAAAFLRDTGTFPQWNPYIFGGMPFVASMNGDLFYPTFLLRLLLPTDAGMTWGLIIHLLLAGQFTYWFLRTTGFGFGPALLGGLAYMMSGQVASLVSPGHDGKLFVSALFPLMLVALTWGVRDGRRWSWGVIALVSGLGVLTPHPQLYQYFLLASGGFALMLSLGGMSDLNRKVGMERLGLALAAVMLGMMIGAVQYVPVMEYVNWSPRAGGKLYEYATSFSMPIEELINTGLPQFSGILDNYWGRNGIHLHSEYLGAGVLVIVAAAFGAKWTGARRRFFWFWTGAGIVSLFWALGGYTPFYKLIYLLVPGTKFFRAPSTIFFITTFSTSVLAALGAERLLDGRIGVRYAYGWLAAGVAFLLFALAGGFAAIAQVVVTSPELVDRIEANAGAVRIGALRSFCFLALTSGCLLLAARRRMPEQVALFAIVGIAAVDLWSVQRNYWQFSAPGRELFASDATIDFVRKQPQPVRVIAYPTSDDYARHDPGLFGDGLMPHRVRAVLGYHGNELGRYDRLGEKDSGWRQVANPTFWALTNADFFLTNSDSLPLEGATRVVGPVRNAAGTTVSLFRLPGSHPFAWVAPAIVKYPDDAVLEALRAPNFPVSAVAIFDTSSGTPAETLTRLPAPLNVAVEVTRYEPGRIALSLSAPAPKGAALVVSENFYPGWSATVDGKAAKVERADYVLMGIPLPAGARQVEFHFADERFAAGRIITLVALALAMALALLGAVFDRRKGSAHD